MILTGNRGIYCSRPECQTLIVPGTEILRVEVGVFTHKDCPDHIPFKRSSKDYDTQITGLDIEFNDEYQPSVNIDE